MVHDELKLKYANSFSHKYYEKSEQYLEKSVWETTYFHNPDI